MYHVISTLVENKPGVLQKVAGLFNRRGFNIDSITVGKSEVEGLSRMVITVKADEKTGAPGWVVTNPDGEEYIVEDSVFQKKYEIDPENPSQYKPKGLTYSKYGYYKDYSYYTSYKED